MPPPRQLMNKDDFLSILPESYYFDSDELKVEHRKATTSQYIPVLRNPIPVVDDGNIE